MSWAQRQPLHRVDRAYHRLGRASGIRAVARDVRRQRSKSSAARRLRRSSRQRRLRDPDGEIRRGSFDNCVNQSPAHQTARPRRPSPSPPERCSADRHIPYREQLRWRWAAPFSLNRQYEIVPREEGVGCRSHDGQAELRRYNLHRDRLRRAAVAGTAKQRYAHKGGPPV